MILQEWKSGAVRTIITSSAFSRGLDIHSNSLIINYNFPTNDPEFIHRIGRAGRFGRNGASISMLTREDNVRVNAVEKFCGVALKPLSLTDLMSRSMEAHNQSY